MANIWSETQGKDRYEVRSAGASLRFYKNGVFHTQYHPERIITGDVWELLLIASLVSKPNPKVLLLGAGGGAIINLLKHYLQPNAIDVVEIDSTVIKIAKKYFLKDTTGLHFYHQDARVWVTEKLKKPKKEGEYDLIIDDLFGEENKQPKRAIEVNKEWSTKLLKLSKKNAQIVINFESYQELKAAKLKDSSSIKSIIKVTSPRYDNCIGLFDQKTTHTSMLRELIRKDAKLGKYSKDYQLRKIK